MRRTVSASNAPARSAYQTVFGPRPFGQGVNHRGGARIEREHRRAGDEVEKPLAGGPKIVELAEAHLAHGITDGSNFM